MKIVTWIGLSAMSVGLASCLLTTKYTVGGTVTGLLGTGLVLEDNSGNSLGIAGNGGFTFSSGVANNDAYTVTVQTQPSNPAQTCSVSNGSGTIDKANVTNVIVNCTQAGRYAYVANSTGNSISAYAINATTGALSPLAGSPFASIGTAPVAVTVDPNGEFLYVADNGSNDVAVYAITPDTDANAGGLTSAGVAIPAGSGPIALTVDPTGNYLYVANQADNTVSAYTIASGVATPPSLGRPTRWAPNRSL